ncbi:MAG TPA: C13 family peptidase [Aromatoleum sp.]|uniref:C13 family peptidase n=1 Tax=Aromatoleum sp. TaxID=2307007 RepID=UPI002B4A2090|nr:C13 family peptidase [Aromatoleum sp.]HJV24629.1 C13 family peptidase [Aromatoleum sp.]
MEIDQAESPLVIAPKAGGLLAELGFNLRAGFLFLALHPSAARSLRASVPQLVFLFLLDMAASGALDFLRVGEAGEFNPAGVLPLFFGIPWLLLAAWVAARAAGDESRTVACAVALAALWLAVSVVWGGLGLLPEHIWRSFGEAAMVIWWAPFGLGLLASALALMRTAGLRRKRLFAAVLATIFLIGLPPLLVEQKEALWVAHQDPTIDAAARARRMRSANESVLYAQPRLLEEALDRVKPGRPGVPELFLLAVGGHGGQDVFLREVQSVEALFRERFATSGHSVILVNNPATVSERPIASVTALERSLRVIGQRMNRDEDVLVLFMTSHGSPEHRFDLSLWPYRFDDLTPERLQQMLQAAGIRYRVVVVSACYSGGFVPPLAGNDTLVISAARPDRNSHGCSHEADWTFFGRAFFDEALRNTHSFEMAFDQAKRTVAEREAAEGLEASEPQMAVGNGIRVALSAVERRLEVGERSPTPVAAALSRKFP